ncbi:hypothetical protein CBR_g66779 [Chara braunii]|uniref:Uncharacterized protein n=1 Tax=Chara braunii TaxID=69332 RepID=A0A388K9M9_CHABU|nr:hypothetical protein CBR_g66779 [Chara braunii]|eukprot:GBG66643.1 hypothetical protein CBR_g66779 [Chara braunii]
MGKPPRPPMGPPMAAGSATSSPASTTGTGGTTPGGGGGGGGSSEPRKQQQQLRLTNLDAAESAAAVDAMRAALTASKLAAIAGNESPVTPYFSRTMSESSDDLFEISITRDDAWDAMRFPEDGYSTSFSVGEMFPFTGLGEVPLVFDKRPVGHGGSGGGGVGEDADMEEDMKAKLRGEHPESSGPVSPRDRASLAALSKCFPVIKHSVMDGRIQKSKGGFKNLKRQTSASSFNSDLSYRHTPGSPINGIVEKAPVLMDVERGEKGVMVVGSVGGAGALGVRGRGSGFAKGRGKNRRSGSLSSGYQEQLPEHFGVSDCMLGLAIFMTMSCLCMAIADVLLEVLRIKGQFDHLKDDNRREFLILNLLSALVAYHSLLGIRQCKFDAAKNALQVAWLVDVALLVGDVAFIVKNTKPDATIARLELYLFGGLTFINFLIATYLYIRLSARGHKSGGSSDGVRQGTSSGAGCAGAIVPVGSRGSRSEAVEARLETPLWLRDKERTIEPVAA